MNQIKTIKLQSPQKIFKIANVLICGIFICPISIFASEQNLDSLLIPPKQSNYRIYPVFGQKEPDLELQAILNKKVLIHNKWHSLGDKVGMFFIQSIRADEVILVDKKMQQKVLKLKQNNLIKQNPKRPNN